MSGGKVVHVLSGKPYDVYVGRAMRRFGLAESPWANPHRIGRDGTREEVLRKYEDRVRGLLARDSFREKLADLRGLTLACWCAPKDGALTPDDPVICHGQVLLRLAREGRGDGEDGETEGSA